MSDDIAAPRRFTIFPARVTGPDGVVIDKAKVIATIDGLFVYQVPPGERLARTVLAVDPYQGIRNDGVHWIVTDVNGDDWTVSRGGGCGCGSPLKRMKDQPDKYLLADPDDVRVKARVADEPATA